MIALALALLTPAVSFAQHHDGHGHADHVSPNRGKLFLLPSDCEKPEAWDSISAMCLPYPTGPALTHLMLHGNVFGVGTLQSGPRGRDAFSSTQMLMGNLGTTAGERQYLNLGLMLTAEKWTVPDTGYPLLLQTGEANHEGVLYIDAQHPHSSPIMGLTLTDTIRLGGGDGDFLKLSFAPRGQTADGPIAFMHRPTGAIQPDAPLGHHIGQDVGHISSTVFTAAIKLGANQFEASAFNGAEPKPDEVDLPLGPIDSCSFRYIRFFPDDWIAMASVAYTGSPHDEEHALHDGGTAAAGNYDEAIAHTYRFSGSLYTRTDIGSTTLFQTFLYGGLRTVGVNTFRHSFLHEAWWRIDGKKREYGPFSRIEVLQRLPAELQIPAPQELDGRWVASITLGYRARIGDFDAVKLTAGGMLTHAWLPGTFSGAYDGNPWAGKLFLEVNGMDMWHL